MYSERAGPFNLVGPRRVRQPAVRVRRSAADLDVSCSATITTITATCATLRTLARRFDPLVVTPLGNARLVRSAGIRRVEELDWWQAARRRRCRSR